MNTRAAARWFNHMRTLLTAHVFDRRPAVAYVGGWLGKHNLGDEALFLAFKRLFPGVRPFQFDGGRFASRIWTMMPRRVGGILAGGTLIAKRRFWLEIVQEFLKYDSRFAVFGAGVGDPSYWSDGCPLPEWVPALKQARYLGVRGPQSTRALHAEGLHEATVVGDPALCFAKEPLSIPPGQKRILGINIGWADSRMWGTEEHVTEQAALLAERAMAAGWEVEWFSVWPKDIAYAEEAAARFGARSRVVLYDSDPVAFMNDVGRATVFVGMKLHATMLAQCAGVPSIMLEYRPKCGDYMESVGMLDSNVRTDEFTAERVWPMVEERARDRERFVAELRSRVDHLLGVQAEGVERMLQTLGLGREQL